MRTNILYHIYILLSITLTPLVYLKEKLFLSEMYYSILAQYFIYIFYPNFRNLELLL